MRGGTKHYSNLTAKLGIAEAEIRSVNARKMQLAVKLAQAEREKERALQVRKSPCSKSPPFPSLGLSCLTSWYLSVWPPSTTINTSFYILYFRRGKPWRKRRCATEVARPSQLPKPMMREQAGDKHSRTARRKREGWTHLPDERRNRRDLRWVGSHRQELAG